MGKRTSQRDATHSGAHDFSSKGRSLTPWAPWAKFTAKRSRQRFAQAPTSTTTPNWPGRSALAR
eukprot:42025-Pyramimonas_sp.AAC.1